MQKKINEFENLWVHLLNVSKYALLLGKEINLKEEDLKTLEIGGILHDIGKLYIPINILNKKTSLTTNEFEIIKRHTIIGDLLLPCKNYTILKEIIRSHHERIDGKGYPDKLKDNNIPYFAKIISIDDAFDAMTTKRSYNNVKTLNEALNELHRCSIPTLNEKNELVQQFDTYLVDKFINAIKNDSYLMEYFNAKDAEIINERNNKKFYKK